jgi:hypothetical protein
MAGPVRWRSLKPTTLSVETRPRWSGPRVLGVTYSCTYVWQYVAMAVCLAGHLAVRRYHMPGGGPACPPARMSPAGPVTPGVQYCATSRR